MGAPLTTGQLRTTLNGMQIGDYIVCKYVAATSGVIGTFSELGTTTAAEIPVAGSATPNGSFYFTKSDKGLLISDRVIQHSISWDTLNTAKLIQGLPWDNGNIIPTMTSNTAPSGVASASSIANTTYEAWKAFDRTSASAWQTASGQTTGWISYQFTSLVAIAKYTVQFPSGVTSDFTRGIKSWTFEGSNDGGVTWVILDTQVEITGWANDLKRSYLIPISKQASFTLYRLNISANNGGSFVTIGELEMFETAGIIRSLTGGVAYADANGNSSTTDASMGAWPTNNEWDKYIVHFPTDKIQSGSTVNDVFHVLNPCPFTWTQDTASGIAAHRVIRGYTSTASKTTSTSSNVPTTMGFRPAFEYLE